MVLKLYFLNESLDLPMEFLTNYALKCDAVKSL